MIEIEKRKANKRGNFNAPKTIPNLFIHSVTTIYVVHFNNRGI